MTAPDSQDVSGVFHPQTKPDFDLVPGDYLSLDGQSAWMVLRRYWSYDDVPDDPYWPVAMYHKQYAVGRVEGMGHPEQIVSEADLREHNWEEISEERAEEIDL
jgi:hypothetical protein